MSTGILGMHKCSMPRRDLYATEKTCIHCCNYTGGDYLHQQRMHYNNNNNNNTHVAAVALTPLTTHPQTQAELVRPPVRGQEQEQPETAQS